MPSPLLRRLAAQLHARRARWLAASCGGRAPYWDLIDLFYAHAAAGAADSFSASCEGGEGGGGGGGGTSGTSGEGGEGGAEADLLQYPLDVPTWLQLAEEMSDLLVARGRRDAAARGAARHGLAEALVDGVLGEITPHEVGRWRPEA